MNNLKLEANEQNRLSFTVAGNMSTQIAQLNIQLANSQIMHLKDQAEIKKLKDLNAELQNQIDGLRREENYGKRQTGTANKQVKR